MDSPGRAFHVPDDVLRLIFDSLHLPHLVVVSRVSRAWHSVALDHPTYSRDIDTDLADDNRCTIDKLRTDIQLFLRRLFYRHAMGSVVSLDVTISRKLDPGRRAACVDCAKSFAPVYECMGRLIFLGLHVHWRHLPPLFHILSMRPAPCLREFRLSVYETYTSKATMSWIIPESLFSSCAPKLVKLRLKGPLILPDIRPADGWSPLAAFAALTELRLELRWLPNKNPASLRLELFFLHCPMLERLVLRCTDAVYLHRAQTWAALPPPDTLGLRHLSFLGDAIHYMDDRGFAESEAWGRDVDAVVRAFVHPRMETLEVNTNVISETALRAIVAHFGPADALHLAATTRDAYYSRFTLRSVPRGIERTFCQLLSYSDQTDEAMFAECLAPLTAHIVQLTLHRHYDIWDVIVQILSGTRHSPAALPGVEKLTVVLGYEDDPRDESDRERDASYGAFPGQSQLHLPGLRCLELQGPNCDRPLTVDDVAFFMGRVLRRLACRDLRLILRDVTLQGDTRRLWGYFENIRKNLKQYRRSSVTASSIVFHRKPHVA